MRWAGHAAHMEDMGNITNIWSEKLKGRDQSEDLGVGRKKILEDLREVGRKVLNWTSLDQDTDQWRILMSIVLNLRVPYKAEHFLTR
jgi:hypothetical protein